LSAWKAFSQSRWSLRVNPSSGNLHPTEAYVVAGALTGLGDRPAVYHYVSESHGLERRVAFADEAWRDAAKGRDVLLVALTSIHWRESWKYGERAFRYCQHDLGHAVAALSLSARMLGWQSFLLPSWSHRQIAALLGLDRHGDFFEAEAEDPACVMVVGPDAAANHDVPAATIAGAVSSGEWTGRASQLSAEHVQWTFIDEIAAATEDHGHAYVDPSTLSAAPFASGERDLDARQLVLQRRSAVAFDGRSRLPAEAFFGILARVMPAAHAPWSTLWWTPRLHLVLFVHRVDDLAPGMYLLARTRQGLSTLAAAIGPALLRDQAHPDLPLLCLARGDCRSMSRSLNCDQDIAADGFFSLGMIAEFDAAIDEHGPSFYRHLFWESGVIGQVLYLEAEAAGFRGTGIGCFYDDPVHDVLGLKGHAFQSLYHFTVGGPIEDHRLTTEPGYHWEQ
jgi:SagB-type dehydrogenase family enzyme